MKKLLKKMNTWNKNCKSSYCLFSIFFFIMAIYSPDEWKPLYIILQLIANQVNHFVNDTDSSAGFMQFG